MHNLRKSLGFSQTHTSDHLQPPSVHDVRLQRVRYVELVAAHITVQVRSQNSNPQDQERYITCGALATHLHPDCNAGRWSSLRRRRRLR